MEELENKLKEAESTIQREEYLHRYWHRVACIALSFLGSVVMAVVCGVIVTLL